MDTKKDSAVSDVPTFKVARVGKDRKRKGAGFSWLRSGGGKSGWSGATGGSGGFGGAFGGMAGSGVGGAGSFLASKFTQAMLAVMLASGLGSAAIYVGYMGGQGADEPVKKAGPFVAKGDVPLEGDTTNLPGGSANQIPNSLGYLSGSLDGMTPEERAKKAAEEAARKAAEEEAARKAEEEAARNAAAPAVDPNALLASAQADGQNKGGSKLGSRFGQLSSSFGGGSSSLAGGAGLSGGVNRSFGSGGSIKKGSTGQLSRGGTVAKPSYSRTSNAKPAGSNVKGFARRQLANANALSRRGATAGKSETASYDAASAFDNNQGAGNVISGPGIGSGAKPSSTGDSTPNPGGNTGGPTGNSPTDCGPGNAVTADGGCAPIYTPKGKNVDKNTWMFQVAQTLLMLMTILAAMALMANSMNWAFAAGEAFKKFVGAAMYAVGGIVMALGIAMLATTGDKIAGGILTGIGGLILAMAFLTPDALSGQFLQKSVLPVFVSAALGGMMSAMSHKPPAASQ